jgi:hypothetical protein
MGFFDRFRHDETDDDWDDDAGDLSSTYIGGTVAFDVVVARSAGAVVALRKIVAYPEYFEFTMEAWVRQPVRRASLNTRWDFSLLDAMDIHRGSAKEPELLRIGLQFPDGGSVSNIDPSWWRVSPDASPPAHGMMARSGEGSMRHAEQNWRAWPVPDEGTLTVVCEWPAYGIDETRFQLDAPTIQAAAERSQPVWSDPSTLPAAKPAPGSSAW